MAPRSDAFWPKAQKVYSAVHNAFHIEKGYNFPLFIICVGALMGFSLSRMMYFNIDGVFSGATVPSDAVHYHKTTDVLVARVGIIMHIFSILPAGFLACFQFVPVIRHKVLLFHRINGYVVNILLLVSIVATFMLYPRLLNYDTTTALGLGALGTICAITMTLGYINIKRLQIEQHRAWMMRTWAYAASIISLRLIQLMANDIINNYFPDRFHATFTCLEIFKMYSIYDVPDEANPTGFLYPLCAPNGTTSFDPTVRVIVPANTNRIMINGESTRAGPEMISALAATTFGLATWCAVLVHTVAVEVYLRLTPKESQRLREYSYKRQVEAGMRHPGNAGLTAQRVGDAPEWIPINKRDRGYSMEADEGSSLAIHRDDE